MDWSGSFLDSNIFYLVVAGMFLGERITSRILLSVLRRRVGLFKKRVSWRMGLGGQFSMVIFSLAVVGLLGWKEQFGLTLKNLDQSLWLILTAGFPFAALFAVGAFIFMRKSGEGKRSISHPDWMEAHSDRVGQLLYNFSMNGLGEEMFFRGLIQGYLSINMTGFILLGSFPLLYSTLLASVIFILIHLENVKLGFQTMSEYLFMLPYLTIVTLILAITFQMTGSLVAPVVIHNVSNGFLSVAAIKATKRIV